MSDAITARQRNYALALGLKIDSATISRQQLSQMIDNAKGNMSGMPNQFQVSLAGRFGITFDANANGWDYCGALFEALSVKSFVYSVYRRHCEARWKFYDEAGLSEAWVSSACKGILADSTLTHATNQYAYTESQTESDLWCNMGKAWLKNEAVRYVLSQLGVDAPSPHAATDVKTMRNGSSMTTEPMAPMLLPLSEAIDEPPVIYRHQRPSKPVKRLRRRKLSVWQKFLKVLGLRY